MTLLQVENLKVGYGDLIAVRDVSFSVAEGEIFVLLGANGAGKTTTLRTISGMLRPIAGRIVLGGVELGAVKPHVVARRGISHVPEGRRVFPYLSVDDNLTVSYLPERTKQPIAEVRNEVYELFPRLRERHKQLAGTMSGGEQQMLAIGRALMNRPKLLMLDEPSLGLSPVMTDLVFERLQVIRGQGVTILLVEQNASAIDLATSGVVISNGTVTMAGDRQTLANSDFIKRAYLGS
jgi:branched-chain amino acid transport system ATP-binding protein